MAVAESSSTFSQLSTDKALITSVDLFSTAISFGVNALNFHA
jgi:hypothetical protein